MSDFLEFLHMGGYAFYVWASYGLVLLVLVANWVAAVLRERGVEREISRSLRREDRP